jgi:meso-butanediol dehydrogenase/(S,S)-butanediol dehydrogenase/diacetyl reductase
VGSAAPAHCCSREGARVAGCDLDHEAAAATEAGAQGRRRDDRDRRRRPRGCGRAEAVGRRRVATYDGVDVLFSNASAIGWPPIGELAVEDWDFTIRNEMDLVSYTTKAAWPRLVRTGGASVISMGSIAAMRGVEFTAQNAPLGHEGWGDGARVAVGDRRGAHQHLTRSAT